MEIIGIMGGSGSGKSTVSDIIKNIYGNRCTIVRIDDFMHEYTRVRQEELASRLGIPSDDGLILNHLSSSIDRIKYWISTIGPDVDAAVNDSIQQLASSYDVIILDWAFLPLLKSLFDRCSITIRVSCDYDLKMNRLRARLSEHNKSERWDDRALDLRIRNSDLEGYQYRTDLFVENSGEIEILGQMVKHLIKSLVDIDCLEPPADKTKQFGD